MAAVCIAGTAALSIDDGKVLARYSEGTCPALSKVIAACAHPLHGDQPACPVYTRILKGRRAFASWLLLRCVAHTATVKFEARSLPRLRVKANSRSGQITQCSGGGRARGDGIRDLSHFHLQALAYCQKHRCPKGLEVQTTMWFAFLYTLFGF